MLDDGDKAVLHYTCRLATGPNAGAVIDTTDSDIAMAEGIIQADQAYEPLEFEIGADEMHPDIEAAVRELAPGERVCLTVDPEAAFGLRKSPELLSVTRPEIESNGGFNPPPPRVVQPVSSDIGWISESEPEIVFVDFNHDHLGLLKFEIRLLEHR